MTPETENALTESFRILAKYVTREQFRRYSIEVKNKMLDIYPGFNEFGFWSMISDVTDEHYNTKVNKMPPPLPPAS